VTERVLSDASRRSEGTEGANGIWKQLLAEFEPPPIDPARAEAIDDFIARRKRELATGTSG
jgi:trimethylamine--corrinoid protein Co-methyltransferase